MGNHSAFKGTNLAEPLTLWSVCSPPLWNYSLLKRSHLPTLSLWTEDSDTPDRNSLNPKLPAPSPPWPVPSNAEEVSSWKLVIPLHSWIPFPASLKHYSVLFSPAHSIWFQPLCAHLGSIYTRLQPDSFLPSQNHAKIKGLPWGDSCPSLGCSRINWMLEWKESGRGFGDKTGPWTSCTCQISSHLRVSDLKTTDTVYWGFPCCLIESETKSLDTSMDLSLGRI